MSARLLAMALLATLPAAAADWFPPKDMMTIGVYYYPGLGPKRNGLAIWPT